MSLPKIGTQEWKDEIAFYQKSGKEALEQRAEKLGIKVNSYKRAMLFRGVYKDKNRLENEAQWDYDAAKVKKGINAKEQVSEVKIQKDSEEIEPIIVNLPQIKFKKIVWPKSKQDEEIAVLLCSDGHAGKKTKSFDSEVYKARMNSMFEHAMKLVELHRHMYPIKKLQIINTGDNCQGENPFQGSTIGSAEMGATDQVVKLAGPTWINIIANLRNNFESVSFDGFGGNHGHDKLAPETSSLDLFLYHYLQSAFRKENGIQINIHEEFGDIININGFKFFAFHGDGIPCQNGVPLIAIERKLKSWYMQYGGFNYAVSGHFHKHQTTEISSVLEYFMIGSLVTDDEWALKKLGISSNPSQWLLGVHPRRGITWRYPLAVDDKFLPKPN